MRVSRSALDFARYFIELAQSEDNEDACGQMTNMYINKLLYMVQGWSLVETGHPAFREPLQAWRNGPVVEEVYRTYKRFGDRPVSNDEVGEAVPALDPDEVELARFVWNRYKKYSAYALSDLTHKQRPWKNARGSLSVSAQSQKTLSLDDLQQTFESISLNSQKKLVNAMPEVHEFALKNTREISGGKDVV